MDRFRWLASWVLLVGGCAPTAVAPPSPPPPVVQVLPPPPSAVVPSVPEPEPTPPPVYDEVKDAATLLVDGLEKRELRRAYLETADTAYWSLAQAQAEERGLSASSDPPPRPEVIVTEHHPQHLRVRVTGRGVELLLYLRHSAFAKTNTTRTPLLRSSGRPFVDAGVSLPPGAKLELTAHRAGLPRAVIQTDWFSAEGALHEENLGRVFELEAPREPKHDRWGGTFDCSVKAHAVLRAEPDGAEVARLEAGSVPCTHVSDLGGWHRVQLERGGYRIRAVVPSDMVELAPTGFGYGTTGGGGWWGASHTTYRYLWPGDRLFAPDDAMVVGRVTTRRLRVGDHGATDDGLHEVYLPLPHWGFTDLRVQAATMRSAIDKEARYQGRVAFEHVQSPTGHEVHVLRKQLEHRRASVNRCFDAALRRAGPDVSFRYRVSLPFGPSSRPTLEAMGSSDASMERCLTRALRVTHPPGNAVARFVLRLTPDAAVGP